jgi:hypothetical protein
LDATWFLLWWLPSKCDSPSHSHSHKASVVASFQCKPYNWSNDTENSPKVNPLCSRIGRTFLEHWLRSPTMEEMWLHQQSVQVSVHGLADSEWRKANRAHIGCDRMSQTWFSELTVVGSLLVQERSQFLCSDSSQLTRFNKLWANRTKRLHWLLWQRNSHRPDFKEPGRTFVRNLFLVSMTFRTGWGKKQ